MTFHLAHVVLQTPQLTRMRDWYCTVLEATVVFQNRNLCFITFDEEHHRLAFKRLDEHVERTPTTVGLHHTAYTVGSMRALSDCFVRLRDVGIDPVRTIQHGVTTSFYYEDPDGNAVEVQVDNFATPDAATAYMEGAEYSADPLGPFFDPAKLVTAVCAGVPDSEIGTRAWALENPSVVTTGVAAGS